MDRVAISNIAWTAEEDRDVARLLTQLSVGAIEVAPSRLFADPLRVWTRRRDMLAHSGMIMGSSW